MREIRDNIDRMDRILVPLLIERGEYVRQAAQYKPTRQDTVVPARIEDIVQKVRAMAENEAYGDPNLVEAIYRVMINEYIAHEKREWDRINTNTDTI
jgi:isochorismate pyruvate lyase